MEEECASEEKKEPGGQGRFEQVSTMGGRSPGPSPGYPTGDAGTRAASQGTPGASLGSSLRDVCVAVTGAVPVLLGGHPGPSEDDKYLFKVFPAVSVTNGPLTKSMDQVG